MSSTERYIFAVTKRIPQSQRADIEKELRSLIEDMIDERGGYSLEVEEDVLKELGDPKILANNYSGRGRYLISPEIYDIYITVVKIAVPIIAALSVLGICIDAINSDQSILEFLIKIPGGALSAAFSVFGVITLIFALNERYLNANALKEIKDIKSRSKEWSPKDLPEVEQIAKPFTKSGAIVSIIFILIFMFLINTDIPVLLAVKGQSYNLYSVLNRDIFSSYLIYINIILTLQLALQTSKLILRKWTYTAAACNMVLNICGLILFFMIVNDAGLIRSDFWQSVSTVNTGTQGSVHSILNIIKKVLTVMLPLGILYDSGKGFYFAYKNSGI